MAQHCPFGSACGASGVLEYGNVVVEIHGDGIRIARVIDQIGKVDDFGTRINLGEIFSFEESEQDALDLGQDSRHRTDDHFLEALGLGKHGSDLGIEHLKIHRYHDLGFTVIDLECEFAFHVKRVVIDDCGTGTKRAVVADYGVGSVGQAQANPSPLGDAHLL